MYFYWCEADRCFYPVSYATTVVPTLNVPLIQINVTVINTNTNDNSNAAPTAPTVSAPVAVAGSSPTLLPVGYELPEPPAE